MPSTAANPDATDPTLFIQGPAGRIEALLDQPDADARPLLAIICHPLPTEGGTMHNKVVTMTARALRESGATTLRFNFRGVGLGRVKGDTASKFREAALHRHAHLL